MVNDSGVTNIRLRGANANLASMLPGLHQLGAQCQSLGSFIDESIRYLGSVNLTVMTFEYHAGTREITVMVRG